MSAPTPPHDLPAPPPGFVRRVRLGRLEAIGLPVLALLPCLALSGLLGPTDISRSAQLALIPGTVALRVQHPSRLRHRGSGSLLIEVVNTGDQPLPALSLGISEGYLDRFSRADLLPATAADSRSGRLAVGLPALRAGERTRLHIRLEADGWGRHRGWVDLTSDGRPGGGPGLVRLDFDTVVLP
ncbi:MAG: hypothetical protein IBJ04_07000 [Hydrogenophaga sp.]|uniref:Uncharacterized protein n=1 Tax=Hydrogenophaga crocea TaxID=2716225 RepID=A0A6G8IFB0_9BURK|nr:MULTISPECIES: hypothetical protein [Hydrogenophaga]MBL0944055.1 hypothetical protein [Hydrogenophaga sp.]QIM51799.1 hypothetical protein G9Q37_06415 [Hydrogenophaga crocea]